MRVLVSLIICLSACSIACKPTCQDLTTALELAKASGNPVLIEQVEKEWAKSGCAAPVEPPPVTTCPDGFPPFEGKCPTVCADLACEWGCEQTPAGAFCKPKPVEPPPVTPPIEPPPVTPPPPVIPPSVCPKALAPGASIVFAPPKKYGNGLDSTLLILNDPEFCRLIHGVSVNKCHMEGWPTAQECTIELLGGKCPTWRYRSGVEVGPCHDDRWSAAVSCDHFGSAGGQRDDPKTEDVFEGTPAVCGLQRDEFGPMAGFWVMPQCSPGKECSVAVCIPGGQCSPFTLVTWR